MYVYVCVCSNMATFQLTSFLECLLALYLTSFVAFYLAFYLPPIIDGVLWSPATAKIKRGLVRASNIQIQNF